MRSKTLGEHLKAAGLVETVVRSKRRASSVRGVKNGTESKFGEVLETLKLAGEIESHQFEAMTYLALRIEMEGGFGDTRYTPDYVVTHHDGRMEILEVKGRKMQATDLRLRAAAQRWPRIACYQVRREGKAWTVEPYGSLAVANVGWWRDRLGS